MILILRFEIWKRKRKRNEERQPRLTDAARFHRRAPDPTALSYRLYRMIRHRPVAPEWRMHISISHILRGVTAVVVQYCGAPFGVCGARENPAGVLLSCRALLDEIHVP